MNLNPCWQWRKHAQGLPLGSWRRNGSARPSACSSQQGFETQSLQRVSCDRPIQVLEPNTLCPRGHVRPTSSPNSEKKKGKDSTTCTQTDSACGKTFVPTIDSCATSVPTRRFSLLVSLGLGGGVVRTRQFFVCTSHPLVGEQCDGKSVCFDAVALPWYVWQGVANLSLPKVQTNGSYLLRLYSGKS